MDNYDSLPCGVLITDQQCNIHYCNDLFASVVYPQIDEIIGNNLNSLLTNGSKILFQQLVLPSIINQEPINEIQLNFLDKKNKKLPMVVFAKRDKTDNGKLFWCCFSAIERDMLLNSLKQSRNQLEETNEQLKALSKTDELTGCCNRREMLLKLRMIRRQMERSQSSFALMMLDLDKIIETNFILLYPEMTLGEVVMKAVAKSPRNHFPVINEKNQFLGILTINDIRSIMFDKDKYDTVKVESLMHAGSDIIYYETDNAEDILNKFKQTGAWNLVVLKDGAKTFYKKVDLNKVSKENATAGLMGTWMLINNTNPNKLQILTFKAPNEFVLIEKDENSQSTNNGTWIFNKNDSTLILIGFSMDHLKGLNNIINISSNEISLENNGTNYSFKKEENQAKKQMT